MKKNKKGISPIIATVIIVAITVGAGILLYTMVQPLIKSPIGQAECTKVNFELDKQSSCISADGQIILVSIDRTMATNDEPTVVGWKIVLSSGEGEKVTIDPPETWEIVEPGRQRTQGILIAGSGLLKISSIEVYPVIKTEMISEQCANMMQRATLSACTT